MPDTIAILTHEHLNLEAIPYLVRNLIDSWINKVSSEPIVKSGNVVRREPDIQIPQVLRDMRKALGFDYGKFDFVLVDGEPVLLDVNKTPSFNSTDPSPKLLADIEYLASGLEDFLPLKGIGSHFTDIP